MGMARLGLSLLVGSCLVLLAVACEEGGNEATATPAATATATTIVSPAASPATATPTVAPETLTAVATPEVAACPDDDPAFCAFAAQVEEAITSEDVDFFVANSLTETIQCTAEVADVVGPCLPPQIGETITGILYDGRSLKGFPYDRVWPEFRLMRAERYRDFCLYLFAWDLPEERDTEGSGELRIWGLAYPVPPGDGTPRDIVLTMIGEFRRGLHRQAIILRCELADGQWQIKSFLHVFALPSPREEVVEWPGWRDWVG
ncbi:MAG: hypothetical protein AMJ38_04955 [Dehalococcoidia bacterium DG_22]|nr:MAG: hypothetical protein AMJ38_04955 [Dehalococcoidia bacterium DG_22]